jgi:hypothetical protein
LCQGTAKKSVELLSLDFGRVGFLRLLVTVRLGDWRGLLRFVTLELELKIVIKVDE